MPTIREKLNFNFDGMWSDVYKLIHVSLDSSMFEETLIASREIVETKVRGNSKPLLNRVEESPLEFEMTIAFQEGFTDDLIDGVIRWLFVTSYKPLYFEGKENKIYYCMPTGDSQIVHTGLNEGYFTLKMRCDSSNIYSQTIITNMETVSTTKTITVTNDGHFDLYPEISITKIGNGTVTMEFIDDGRNIFEVRDLTNGEDIYINCEKEIIETDIIGVYRYDKIVGHFPRLVYGSNRIKITGDCKFQLRYTNKYRF